MYHIIVKVKLVRLKWTVKNQILSCQLVFYYIMTISIKDLFVTLSINDTQHNNKLSVIIIINYNYARCRVLFIVMLNAMLIVVIVSAYFLLLCCVQSCFKEFHFSSSLLSWVLNIIILSATIFNTKCCYGKYHYGRCLMSSVAYPDSHLYWVSLMLSVIILSIAYTECHLRSVSLYWVSLMLSVTMRSVTMLSVSMLSVTMLSVTMLSVIMLSVILLSVTYAECRYAERLLCWASFMLSVIMLSVVKLSVVMPSVACVECHLCWVSLVLSVTCVECHLCTESQLSLLCWVSYP